MKSQFLSLSRIIFSVLAVICMVVIFCFSREDSDKSSETSGRLTNTAVHIAVENYDNLPKEKQMSIMDKATHIVRKSAHFCLYATLGFLVSMAVGRRKLFSLASLGVLIFCFMYAFSDEIHQFFVPGRSCEFRDMMIDTSGALSGMLVSMFIMFILRKLFGKNEQEITALQMDAR